MGDVFYKAARFGEYGVKETEFVWVYEGGHAISHIDFCVFAAAFRFALRSRRALRFSWLERFDFLIKEMKSINQSTSTLAYLF